MQTNTRSTTARDDIRVLNATLRKRLLTTHLIQAGVIGIAIMIWIWIARQILRLGGLIRYDGLKSMGPEFVRIMTDINPYLWWGVVAILSLIVLSLLRNWFVVSQKQSRALLVPVSDVQKLAGTLSDDAIQVLRWVWDSNADPITVGDLMTTRAQLRSGRVRKLAMAQAHALALGSASAPALFNVRDIQPEPRHEAVTASAPTLRQTDTRTSSQATDTGTRNEPTLERASSPD